MEYIIGTAIVIAIVAAIFAKRDKTKKAEEERKPAEFPVSWRTILNEKVEYYANLSGENKLLFEDDIVHFFNTVQFEGVKTDITITDKLLVASSAVIPVFGFPQWQYHFLKYVVLYPGAFDRNFKFDNKSEYITGMVGNGIMEGRVILSKQSLHLGFSNARDKKNVGIHEFIHLIDKQDGVIDGIPTALNQNEYVLPWLELIRAETKKILEGENNDINPYGATDQVEFLTVTGEYFFENPHLLEKKYPELFRLLSKAFNQDPGDILPVTPKLKSSLGRNSPCACNSGKKLKHCCMNKV
jgi:Mlc titration factor MtfA (ptsG expression regulator)